MARRRRTSAKGSEKHVIANKTAELDQDMRALRRAFKAIKALSPEARQLLRTKIRTM